MQYAKQLLSSAIIISLFSIANTGASADEVFQHANHDFFDQQFNSLKSTNDYLSGKRESKPASQVISLRRTDQTPMNPQVAKPNAHYKNFVDSLNSTMANSREKHLAGKIVASLPKKVFDFSHMSEFRSLLAKQKTPPAGFIWGQATWNKIRAELKKILDANMMFVQKVFKPYYEDKSSAKKMTGISSIKKKLGISTAPTLETMSVKNFANHTNKVLKGLDAKQQTQIKKYLSAKKLPKIFESNSTNRNKWNALKTALTAGMDKSPSKTAAKKSDKKDSPVLAKNEPKK